MQNAVYIIAISKRYSDNNAQDISHAHVLYTYVYTIIIISRFSLSIYYVWDDITVYTIYNSNQDKHI